MSFILDALKKSENERQRKAGPALYEVKLAPPRNRLPWWMITVGGLLGVNLIFVVWLLIRSPSVPPSGATTLSPAPAALTPAAAPAGSPSVASTAAAPAGAAPTNSAPATSAPATMPPTLSGGVPAGQVFPGSVAALAADDLAPAVEPLQEPADRVQTTTEAGIPSYQDAVAKNTRIPSLHLDFHLYAARPQDRFVFINMKKMHEGDSTPEGVRVESINDEGAVLSFQGTRFTLLHE